MIVLTTNGEIGAADVVIIDVVVVVVVVVVIIILSLWLLLILQSHFSESLLCARCIFQIGVLDISQSVSSVVFVRFDACVLIGV